MTVLRLLNPQGLAGLAAALCLALLLVAQKLETRHWRKQSHHFEAEHRKSEATRVRMIAAYAAAAEQARAADRAKARRVGVAQDAINHRSENDFEARIARARADARRLRQDPAAGHRGGAGRPAVPGLSAAPAGAAQAPGPDRLSDPDRLLATEQAIQLDELIRWVKAQAAVDPNAPPIDE